MKFLNNGNVPFGAGFAVALSAIVGALLFQYVGGLEPCVLCLQQRTPYYVGLPILFLAFICGNTKTNLGTGASLLLTAVAIVVFAWGIDTGVYHAGAEWGFWTGPEECSRTTQFGESLDTFVAQLQQIAPIDCTKPAIRILGLSLAGWNVVASTLTILLLAWSAKRTADKIVLEIKG